MTTKYLAFLLMFTLLIPTSSVFGDDNLAILAETDKNEYHTGDILKLSGFILERKMPEVAIRVYDPDETILVTESIALLEDNSFSKEISLDSPFFEKEGIYTIKINYGKLVSNVDFSVLPQLVQEIPVLDTKIVSDESQKPEILSLKTSALEYHDGEIVTIIGTVSSIDPISGQSVLVGIYDTFGNPAGFYFGDIGNNLEFNVSFLAKSGINFKKDGTYSISAHYGTSNLKTDFKFSSIGTDTKQTDTKQTDTKQTDTKQTDTKQTDTKQTDTKQTDTKQTDTKQTDTKQTDTKQTDTKQTDTKQTDTKQKIREITNDLSAKYDNLTVEDAELGIQLNQINLKCDSSKFVDDVLYYDGMGPALLRLCKYNEAGQFFDNDIIKSPTNIQAITDKGVVLSKMGFYEDAIGFYDSALSLNSKYVPALNNKANALAYLGKINEANTLWQSVSDMAPNYQLSKINFEKNSLENSQINNIDYNYENSPSVSSAVDTTPKQIPITSDTNPILENIGTVLNTLASFFGIIR